MNQDEYDSSWQWTVERSKYHFDKWKQDADGEWFTRLGQFVGDWQAEIDDIKSKAAPMNWENRKFFGKDNPNYSPKFHLIAAIAQEVCNRLNAEFGSPFKKKVSTNTLPRSLTLTLLLEMNMMCPFLDILIDTSSISKFGLVFMTMIVRSNSFNLNAGLSHYMAVAL